MLFYKLIVYSASMSSIILLCQLQDCGIARVEQKFQSKETRCTQKLKHSKLRNADNNSSSKSSAFIQIIAS